MRTTTTSVTKTCASCGMVNKVVIMTAGIPPRWRIGCSECGHVIVGVDGPGPVERVAEVIPLPVPAMRPRAMPAGSFGALRPIGQRRELRPVGYGWDARRDVSPALDARRRQAEQDLARRLWIIRTSARTSTGASLAAVCGIVLAAFMLDGKPSTGTSGSTTLTGGSATGAPVVSLDVTDGTDGTRLAANGGAAGMDGAPGFDGAPAPVYSYPRLSPEGRATIPGVPAAATAAAGDPGIASIIDLRRPMPAVYPDPREGMQIRMLAERNGIEVAASDEDALDLSRDTRRAIQRRLQLARHDPHSIDGIFGPVTRTAIAEWQAQAGLPATGYLDAAALAVLVDSTEAGYRAWRIAEQARRETQQVAGVTPAPRPRQEAATGCARQSTGEVAYGESVRCDFRGLRESIAGLFEKPAPSPWARRTESRHRPGGA